MEIGTRLRKLRDKLKLTSREVAEKTGVSLSTYLDWEHDKTTPSLKSFSKLSQALQLCPVGLMSYFAGKDSINSIEENDSISELKEIIGHYRHYAELLKAEKVSLEDQLNFYKQTFPIGMDMD